MDDLVLVNLQNMVLGVAPKDACHDGDGIMHRAFSIFVFNSKNEVLLQKRADEKRLWPSFWSNSCCSHPRLTETMIAATRRRLAEELGISGYKIVELYQFSYQVSYLELGSENELCSVLICRSDDDLAINPTEVSATRWLTMIDLEKEIATDPGLFTPWFQLEVKELIATHLVQINSMNE